jgi:hypothetical protein
MNVRNCFDIFKWIIFCEIISSQQGSSATFLLLSPIFFLYGELIKLLESFKTFQKFPATNAGSLGSV